MRSPSQAEPRNDTGTDQLLTTVNLPAFNNANTLAITPDGARVFAVAQNAQTLFAIDTATNSLIGSVDIGASATGVAVSPDGNLAYVSTGSGGSNVTVLSTSSPEILTTVALTGGGSKLGQGVGFAPDG